MFIKQTILDKGWGPGGWPFYQPQTDWHAPYPLATNFRQQVENIRQHREANPRFDFSTDPTVIAQELEEYTLARWRRTYREAAMQKFLEHPDESLKKNRSGDPFTPKSPPSLLGKAAGLAGVDTAVLEDWFGAGGVAVPLSVATSRAMVCADCPGNRKGTWRDVLTIPVAKMLRTYFSAKNQMRLSTPLDKELGMCKACGCVLELKCWTPLHHVLDNLDEEQTAKLRELNQRCWITTETP